MFRFLANVNSCVYLDELLHALSAAKVGCYVGDIFVGGLAYADDIVLFCLLLCGKCSLEIYLFQKSYPRSSTSSSGTAFTDFCPHCFFWANRFLILVFT